MITQYNKNGSVITTTIFIIFTREVQSKTLCTAYY